MTSRVSKTHQQFDKFAAKWLAGYLESGRTIYCCEGCSGCCHLAVHATWPEAAYVAAQLSVQQTIKLGSYVERLQVVLPELFDLKSYLKRHRQALGPCPFLDTSGACSIYPARPLSCRALLSTRPAAWCTVDFAELSDWDKRAYETSLDRQVVAWPTHYVAATQDFGRELEEDLLDTMMRQAGWALSGNFAVMVWLAWTFHSNDQGRMTKEQGLELLMTHQLNNNLLIKFSESPPSSPD
jgi:Fe-S-cluster containining protein